MLFTSAGARARAEDRLRGHAQRGSNPTDEFWPTQQS